LKITGHADRPGTARSLHGMLRRKRPFLGHQPAPDARQPGLLFARHAVRAVIMERSFTFAAGWSPPVPHAAPSSLSAGDGPCDFVSTLLLQALPRPQKSRFFDSWRGDRATGGRHTRARSVTARFSSRVSTASCEFAPVIRTKLHCERCSGRDRLLTGRHGSFTARWNVRSNNCVRSTALERCVNVPISIIRPKTGA
jgi:hypothetical protein